MLNKDANEDVNEDTGRGEHDGAAGPAGQGAGPGAGGADLDEATAALAASLMEVERHVAAAGWEDAPRLFALVPTVELQAAEPGWAAQSGQDTPLAPGHLSAIEQDEFDAGTDLAAALARVAWPATVAGCAVSLVNSFLPAEAEAAVPDDPEQAQAYVAGHPDRQDVRVVVGVMRGGQHWSVARLASHPEDLLGGPGIMPGIDRLLTQTLAEDDGDG